MNIRNITYLIPSLLIPLMFSCSSSDDLTPEVEEQVPVLFGNQSPADRQTRAGSTFIDGTNVVNLPKTMGKDDGDNLVQKNPYVGVFGYYQGSSTWDTWSEKTANFLYNQQMAVEDNVAIKDANGVTIANRAPLTYAPMRYWPNQNGEMCSFFGYYPFVESGSNAATGSSTTKDGDNDYQLSFKNNAGSGMGSFSFTVADDEAEQVDFLVSDMAVNMTKQPVNDRVILKFHHMTSQVVVKVKTGSDVTKYTITNLGFNKLKNSGTLTPTCIKNIESGNENWVTNFTWTGHSGEKGYECEHLTDATESQTTQFLLLPQDFTNNPDAVFSYNISYMIEGSDEEKTAVGTIHLDGKDHEGETVKNHFTQWQPGVVYAYTITLGADHIEITMDIDNNWQTGLTWNMTI